MRLLVFVTTLPGLLAACRATTAAPATIATTDALQPTQPVDDSTVRSPAPATVPSAPTSAPAATATATASSATVTQPTPSPIAAAQPAAALDALTQQVDALLDGLTGRYRVVVALPNGQRLYSRDEHEPVAAASLYKLGVMLEVYRQREAGSLDFAETLYLYPEFFIDDEGDGFVPGDSVPVVALLEQMVTASSNVAAAALLDRVGNESINATLRGLGLTETEIRWMPAVAALDKPGSEPADGGPRNLTSAADMALLFERLLAGVAVDAVASAQMLALLKSQQVNDRLPALLPPNAVVAHKTGNLPGLVHDAGVIFAPAEPLIVAALSDEVDEAEATEVIAQLGVEVYDFGTADAN
jgi:beta-lactamase class A